MVNLINLKINKIWQIFIIVVIIILAIFLLIRHEKKATENEIIIEQQEIIIDQKNEVIETKNYQQKIISKTSNNVDFAARSKWMHLIFEERKTTNN